MSNVKVSNALYHAFQGLSQFDPAVNVFDVTRPPTGESANMFVNYQNHQNPNQNHKFSLGIYTCW